MQHSSQAALEEAVDSARVLALIGDLDLFKAEDFEAQVRALASGGDPLCLDFSECTYVDSSILTVLVRVVRSYGSQLEMIVPSNGNVARILSITQLDRLFPIRS